MNRGKSIFLEVFPVGPIQANCILLGDVEAGELVVIDPGEEAERIVDRVRATGLRPTMILHTHGHLDHVGGTAELVRLLGGKLPIGLHPDEISLYRNAPLQAQMFGLEVEAPPEPDLMLRHGDTVSVGGARARSATHAGTLTGRRVLRRFRRRSSLSWLSAMYSSPGRSVARI